MKRKKVCMLGAFAVGKTSLVRQLVDGSFSEKYQTTIGVTIDRKDVVVDDEPVTLVLWDLFGDDSFQHMEERYLRGSSGFVMVIDGTRPATVDRLDVVRERVAPAFAGVPAVILANKHDLESEWEVDLEQLGTRFPDYPIRTTSAKTGSNVETAFSELARALIAR